MFRKWFLYLLAILIVMQSQIAVSETYPILDESHYQKTQSVLFHSTLEVEQHFNLCKQSNDQNVTAFDCHQHHHIDNHSHSFLATQQQNLALDIISWHLPINSSVFTLSSNSNPLLRPPIFLI